MNPINPRAVIGQFQDGLLSIRRLVLLAAISRGADFNNIADLVDSFLDTPQMEECLREARIIGPHAPAAAGTAWLPAGAVAPRRWCWRCDAHSQPCEVGQDQYHIT